MFLLALLFILAPCYAADPLRTKLTIGTVTAPLQGKIPYTASAPLHFVFPNLTEPDQNMLRAIDYLRGHICAQFNETCTLASQWSAEMKNLAREIRNFGAHSQMTIRRVPRTIPILGTLVGRITNWCCGVITEEQTNFLAANSEILHRAVQDLSDALSTEHSQFLNVTHDMESFAKSATARLNNLHFQLSKDQKARSELSASLGHLLLQISVTHAHFHLASLRIQRIRSLLHSCKSRHLSYDAVNTSTLISHLHKLSSFLSTHNSELAIPLSSPQLYYTEKLTSCVLSDNSFHITLQVPVRQKATSWHLTHLLPIAFKWTHHTCRVLTDSIIVLFRDNATIILSGARKNHCL